MDYTATRKAVTAGAALAEFSLLSAPDASAAVERGTMFANSTQLLAWDD